MITELTEKQRELIEVYKNNALNVGYDTSPLDRVEAEKAAREIFDFIGVKCEQVIFVDSPFASQELRSKMEGKEKTTYNPEFYSFWFWSNYYNFYLYILEVLFPEKKDNPEFELLYKWVKWSKALSYIERIDGTVLIAERPVAIHKNDKGLHNETGMALEYKDGKGIYSLNNIQMKEWMVMTKAQDIKIADIFKEANVEVRRELLKKVGIHRVYNDSNPTLLDKKVTTTEEKGIADYAQHGDVLLFSSNPEFDKLIKEANKTLGRPQVEVTYELLRLNLGDGIEGTYLKMSNPSTGEMHIEGVVDECDTVDKALAWRNGLDLTDFRAPGILA